MNFDRQFLLLRDCLTIFNSRSDPIHSTMYRSRQLAYILFFVNLIFAPSGNAPCRSQYKIGGSAALQGRFFKSLYFPGQIDAQKVPLSSLKDGEHVQEFVATPDLGGFAFVVGRNQQFKSDIAGKHKKTTDNAHVVHNGKLIGNYPDIIPYSLRISADGKSVSFSVVLWRTWNLPLYWIVHDGNKIGSSGHYTEDIEFNELAFPWYSPDGSKVAYLIALKKLRHVMINDKKHFSSATVSMKNPWSSDGKKIAYTVTKNNEQRLVVDGKPVFSAPEIHLLRSPDAYVASGENGETLYVENKKCLQAQAFHDIVFSKNGGGFVVSAVDEKGNWKVTLLSDGCSVEKTWKGGPDWKKISELGISENGKKVFFAARGSGGATLFTPLDKTMLQGCGGPVDYQSVTFAAGSPAAAWIVNEIGKDILCVDGKKYGKWDRIELPLVFDKKGGSVMFHAWSNCGLFRKNVEFD